MSPVPRAHTRAPGGIGFGPATSLSAQSSGLVRLALAEPPSARRRIASRRSDPHPPAGAPDARCGRHRLRARSCRLAVLPPCRATRSSVLSSSGPVFYLASPSPSLPPRADGSLRGDQIPIPRRALLTRAPGGIGFGLALAVLPACRPTRSSVLSPRFGSPSPSLPPRAEVRQRGRASPVLRAHTRAPGPPASGSPLAVRSFLSPQFACATMTES